jgi:hypothetical protein
MSQSSDSPSPSPQDQQAPRHGRYRFSRGNRLDPSEGIHPELNDAAQTIPVGDGIPNTPQELIAMQTHSNDASERNDRPEKPVRQRSAKVTQVLELVDSLNTSGLEDQEIAMVMIRYLENYHQEVIDEMRDDSGADHSQIIAWAIDADRLGRARMLLESVDLD